MLDTVAAAAVKMAAAAVCPARFSDFAGNLTQINRWKNLIPEFFLGKYRITAGRGKFPVLSGRIVANQTINQFLS
jgi:hypothetical protein